MRSWGNFGLLAFAESREDRVVHGSVGKVLAYESFFLRLGFESDMVPTPFYSLQGLWRGQVTSF